MLAIGAWTVICMGTVFFVLKHTVGLRVSEEEELSGLDITEHGLANAYSGMVPDLHIVHEESELGLPVQPMGPSESPGIQVTD
jgi:Amt family ammonium transporter